MTKFFAGVLFAALLGTTSAQAATIELDMTVAYSNTPGPVTADKSLLISMIYDTSLNTNTVYIPAGSRLPDGSVAFNPVYGYSASGVVAINMAVDGVSSRVTLQRPTSIYADQPADLYFDADIAKSAPTKVAGYFFSAAPGMLSLGNFVSDGKTTFFLPLMIYFAQSHFSIGSVSSIERTVLVADPVAAVPEPETYAMLLGGLVLLGGLARRRKART